MGRRERRSRPAPHGPATVKTNTLTPTVPAAGVLLRALALVAAPCGRRTLGLALVVRCPACGKAHGHRSGMRKLLAEQAIRPCPVTGRLILLVPGVTDLPAPSDTGVVA